MTDQSYPLSVGECATWIETAARQAVLLEQQAKKISALELERARLREKVEAMLPAKLKMVRSRVGAIFDDRPSVRFQAAEEGFEHAITQVLALLDKSAEKEARA